MFTVSPPTLVSASAGTLTIQQAAISGGVSPYHIQLQRSTDNVNWINAVGTVLATEGELPIVVTDANALTPGATYYYRTSAYDSNTPTPETEVSTSIQFSTLPVTVASEVARIAAVVQTGANQVKPGVYVTTYADLAHAVASTLETTFGYIVYVMFQPDIQGSGGADLYVHGWPTATGL